ncbi:protein lifeguard 2-like [Paramacrobiotus metropolitanus]|uniref:protein lifeguard 2-like n=1 Tax=Paramacrobiotus metropolitanus TaxID=2943436 RepID=UPI002445BA48|nr:protein lifeguard 2-like [Paramacrobiotus metropolitanus]
MYSQQQGPPPQYPYPPPGGQGYMAGPGRVEEGYAYPYPPPPPPPGVVITGAPLDGNGTEFPPRPSNFGASFDDANIRRSFIRKTYAILMVQLLVTLAFICLFVFCAPVKYFVHRNPWFYYLSYGVFLATYLTLVCCTGLTRRYPVNLVLLSIFTLAMSYMTATISSYYDTQIVLMAIGICAVCCLTISVGSAFCKFDMTRYGWVLGIAAIILMLFGLVTLMFAFVPSLHTPWYHGFYSGLIALVFMGFLAYDTQMIIGGRRYALSPEEHVAGAMQLYLDVVYIFLGILGISGAASSN